MNIHHNLRLSRTQVEMILYNSKITLSLKTAAEITHNIYQLPEYINSKKWMNHPIINNNF
jgi:hypothetical protein